MRNPARLAFAVAALCALPVAHARELSGGYFDILSPEVVGETGDKTYDLNEVTDKDGNTKFLGNQTVHGGEFFGAGVGARVLVVLHSGFLVGGEAMVAGGRVHDAQLAWGSTGIATHYEMTMIAGYMLWLGPIGLHGGVVFGFDGMQFDVANPTVGVAALEQGTTTQSPATDFGMRMERFDMRAGLQVGFHVNVARHVAFWADGTYDWDGQYRVRAGLGFGGHDD